MFCPSRILAEALDRLALRMATSIACYRAATPEQVQQGLAMVKSVDFFSLPDAPATLELNDAPEFNFPTPLPSPWPENNSVHGKFYRGGRDWKKQPVVMLIHGWNADSTYHYLFPWLAWRLNRHGLNAMMLQLPYHAQRRPRTPGALRDFLSDDLLSVAQAIRQALAEQIATARALRTLGISRICVWGFSLGAWLAGVLAVRTEQVFDAACLATPVPSMDRVIADLPFCGHIRHALKGVEYDFKSLNLESCTPAIDPANILIIAAKYDLFAPLTLVRNLAGSWSGSQLWEVSHGHISVLMSLPVMERVIRWAGKRLAPTEV